VTDLSLFATEIKTPDGVFIVAPNAELWGKSLKNFSSNPTRSVDIVLVIDYGESIDELI